MISENHIIKGEVRFRELLAKNRVWKLEDFEESEENVAFSRVFFFDVKPFPALNEDMGISTAKFRELKNVFDYSNGSNQTEFPH